MWEKCNQPLALDKTPGSRYNEYTSYMIRMIMYGCEGGRMEQTAPGVEVLAAAGRQLEGSTPQEILQWGVARYFPRLAMATAFGPEGCVLIHMLAEIEPRVFLFNLDTGYQFAETLETRERLMRRYDLHIELVRPAVGDGWETGSSRLAAAESSSQASPVPLYQADPNGCCMLRKVLPLRRALEGFDAWISAIRRDQTPDRAQAGIVEWDRKFGLVKLNPLANWMKQDVWRFIHQHDIPYNPLHDRGYASIGCWPCTRPVGDGEEDRAGRWSGLAKTECGLHSRR